MEVKISHAYLSLKFMLDSYLRLLILILKCHFSACILFSFAKLGENVCIHIKYVLLQACRLNSHFTIHVFALCFGG